MLRWCPVRRRASYRRSRVRLVRNARSIYVQVYVRLGTSRVLVECLRTETSYPARLLCPFPETLHLSHDSTHTNELDSDVMQWLCTILNQADSRSDTRF